MIIVLTGVPGTGKDTVAERMRRRGFSWLSLNRLVKERGMCSSRERGCMVADMGRLSREARRAAAELTAEGRDVVVEGHLACEIRMPADACIVLRTDPLVLRKRLEARGYPRRKIDENIECEELDYCTQRAESNLECPVYEVRTDKSIGGTMRDVWTVVMGRKGRGRLKAGWVDWSARLLQRKRI